MFVPRRDDYKVVYEGKKPLSCYLMWSDVKMNHNKYYVAQALNSKKGEHMLWTRHGRVGNDGVGFYYHYGTEEKLIEEYHKKYDLKTNNGRGYTEVKMALGKPG